MQQVAPSMGMVNPECIGSNSRSLVPVWLWGEGWLDQGCVGDSDLAAH